MKCIMCMCSTCRWLGAYGRKSVGVCENLELFSNIFFLFLPPYNYYSIPEITRMKQQGFLDAVIDRLETCLKDMSAAVQAYRKKSVSKTDGSKSRPKDGKMPSSLATDNPNYYISSMKIFETPIDNLGKGSIKSMAGHFESNPDFMTEEQKDQIRKKLNKDRPKPPANPFICYVKAQKDRIKQSSPKNLSIAEVTAIASEEWKNLPQEVKRPYIEEVEQVRQSYLSKRTQFLKDNPIISKIGYRKQKPKVEKIKLEDLRGESGDRLEESGDPSSDDEDDDNSDCHIKYRHDDEENLMERKINELLGRPNFDDCKDKEESKAKKSLMQVPVFQHPKPQLGMIKVPPIEAPKSGKSDAKEKIMNLLNARRSEVEGRTPTYNYNFEKKEEISRTETVLEDDFSFDSLQLDS